MAAIPLSSSTLFTDANLVSYWPLVANSTDNKDSNNGTDTSISYGNNSGPFSGMNSASFNGSSSKIVLPNSGSNLNITSNFTVMCWTKSASPARTGLIQNWNIPTGDNEYGFSLLTIATSGYARIDIGRGSSGAYKSVLGDVNVCDGSWHLVVATYDGSNVYLYVDNNAAVSTAATLAPVYYATTYPWIGAYNDDANYSGTGGQFFTGSLSDAAVFSRALSSTEVTARYNGTDVVSAGGGIMAFFK